jgi:uncharacterized protein YdiU (UPF0061 family)
MNALAWRFDHSYARLPDSLFARAKPARARDPRLVIFNHRLARQLGLLGEPVAPASLAAQLSGNALPDGAEPIAQAYAGHQFGHFAMLGDGRALLVGEHLCPDDRRVDMQLKGSGQTPFSRRGDGKAALAPMLREYTISEAMHALGIPTTRSLAVVATGEAVLRENILDGAVLARIASSHLRVGTFEYVSARGEPELLRQLVDYAIDRHYPECEQSERPALALLDAVIERQVSLITHWMRVGFIHGVMNTDNMSICGETIDYGPCAFMDAYDPATCFSSIDHGRRYAFGNQPQIAQWNLARLAEALLPLFDDDADRALELAEQSVARFADLYGEAQLAMMRAKLGLIDDHQDDAALISDFLGWMRQRGADYTLAFHMLSPGKIAASELNGDELLTAWHGKWQARLSAASGSQDQSIALMRQNNPVYIPRNHLVEAALAAATGPAQDLGPLERLLGVLSEPYTEHDAHHDYSRPSPDGGRGYQTFCGT